MKFLTTRLLEDLKRLGHFPTNQSTFQDPDLLALMDYELQTYVVPLMMSVRENYFLKTKNVPINSSVGAYPIPDRAIGSKLADLQLVVGNYIEQLRLIQIGQLDSEVGSPVGARAFTLQGNNVVLIPVPTFGVLRMYYHSRPSKLVLPQDCAVVQSIDTVANQVVVNAVPSTFTATELYDFVQSDEGFDTTSEDLAVSLISGNTVTFASPLPASLRVGDYLCLAQQSPIAQIPVELMPLLTQAAVVKVYEIQGYGEKLQSAQSKLGEMERKIMALITPRVSEAPKVINGAKNDVMVSTRFGFNRFRRY